MSSCCAAPANEKTDLYALGITLFRMFAGDYPRNRMLTKLRPDLPSWLGAALSAAAAETPDQRPEDAHEFVYELERHATERAGSPERAKPLYERNPLLFWRVTSLVLLLALIALAALR